MKRNLARLVIQTGSGRQYPERAPAADLARLVDRILPFATSFRGEVVVGTEGVPAHADDLELIARLDAAGAPMAVSYRASTAGVDTALLSELTRRGVRRMSFVHEDESTLEEAVERLGLGPVIARGERRCGTASGWDVTADVDGARCRLELTHRAPLAADDDFQRDHPCRLPFEELALWSTGEVYACREQAPFLDDAALGDWRRDDLEELFAAPVAEGFRRGHEEAQAAFPAACGQCVHPAQAWHLIERARLRAFRDIHRGQRAFVLGNGPSLTKMPLRRLRDEVTIGCNRIHEAFGHGLDEVTYFTCSDPRVWSLLDGDWTRARARQAFLRWPDIERTSGDPIWLIQHDYEHRMDLGWFPRDPAQGLARGRSVLLDISIPLAFYMGFEEVVLIGCDFSYDPKSDNHFYADRNEPWIWEGTRETYRPPFEIQLDGMRVARRAFEDDGRRLINATPGGGLDVLPRVDFETLFTTRGVAP